MTDDAAPPVSPEPPAAWRGPTVRRWALFAALAAAVVVADQLTKAWVVATLAIGDRIEVLGELVRIVHWRNSGALFGMLPDTAGAFAIVSLAVVGLIVWYHAKAGRGIVLSLALALLLGGAIGNLIDRLRYGAVVDFVDVGIGTARFYTFNVADAAISTAIVGLIALALLPRLGEVGAGGR